MDQDLTSLHSCCNVIICMEGGAPKARGLQVLHHESPEPQHDVLEVDHEVHLTLAGHSGLLVCEKSQLIVGQDFHPKLLDLKHSDVRDIGTRIQSDVQVKS